MNKLKKFIASRYGVDTLNEFLLIGSLVLSVLQWISQRSGKVRLAQFISTFALTFAVSFLFRALSKNYPVRRLENQQFESLTWPVRKKMREKQDSKQFTYFTCPNCHHSLRAPKNLGKIKVTCNFCKHKFETRT